MRPDIVEGRRIGPTDFRQLFEDPLLTPIDRLLDSVARVARLNHGGHGHTGHRSAKSMMRTRNRRVDVERFCPPRTTPGTIFVLGGTEMVDTAPNTLLYLVTARWRDWSRSWDLDIFWRAVGVNWCKRTAVVRCSVLCRSGSNQAESRQQNYQQQEPLLRGPISQDFSRESHHPA